MKYSQIIIGFLFLFLLGLSLGIYLFNNKDISSYTEETLLSLGDQEVYATQLEELLAQTGQSYGEAINLAQAYEYLGFYGKSISVYEEYIAFNAGGLAMYHNLGRLYEKFCYEDAFVRRFCKKSIYYYLSIVDSYNDKSYYLDVARVYAYLNNKNKALLYYDEYMKATLLEDDLVLDLINGI